MHYVLNFFFFNDTATTEIYTLSLHDALPICAHRRLRNGGARVARRFGGLALLAALRQPGLLRRPARRARARPLAQDRKSTRLNSSHANISYAVFCLKKKKTHYHTIASNPNNN